MPELRQTRQDGPSVPGTRPVPVAAQVSPCVLLRCVPPQPLHPHTARRPQVCTGVLGRGHTLARRRGREDPGGSQGRSSAAGKPGLLRTGGDRGLDPSPAAWPPPFWDQQFTRSGSFVQNELTSRNRGRALGAGGSPPPQDKLTPTPGRCGNARGQQGLLEPRVLRALPLLDEAPPLPATSQALRSLCPRCPGRTALAGGQGGCHGVRCLVTGPCSQRPSGAVPGTQPVPGPRNDRTQQAPSPRQKRPPAAAGRRHIK